MGALSNNQQYTKATVRCVTPDKGLKTLAENVSVTVDHTTNSQPVSTIFGYRGESPGAAMTEISVDEAVPSVEFDLDPLPYMQDLLPIVFQIYTDGGLVCSFEGIIISSNFQWAVNSAAKLSFKARGSFSTWE